MYSTPLLPRPDSLGDRDERLEYISKAYLEPEFQLKKRGMSDQAVRVAHL
jgi:hypothetical protein